MQTTWIVTADASRARILQVAGRERLVEIAALANPAGRLQNREINTDAAGRFRGPDRPGGHASDDENRAADHQAELFAGQIGEALDKARTQQRFDQLYLVAPPKFLGALRRKLGRATQKLVVDELDKDLSWFDQRSLEGYLARQN